MKCLECGAEFDKPDKTDPDWRYAGITFCSSNCAFTYVGHGVADVIDKWLVEEMVNKCRQDEKISPPTL